MRILIEIDNLNSEIDKFVDESKGKTKRFETECASFGTQFILLLGLQTITIGLVGNNEISCGTAGFFVVVGLSTVVLVSLGLLRLEIQFFSAYKGRR